MKLKVIADFDGFHAFQAYSHLLLGLKMLPMHCGEQWEEFYAKVDLMTPEDQEKIVRQAATFVRLEKDELSSLLMFVTDNNGVPYTKENTKSLKPRDILEMQVMVCKQIAEDCKCPLLSEAEKKN